MPTDPLPDDLEALRSLVSQLSNERDAAVAENRRLIEQNDNLRHLLKKLQNAFWDERDARGVPHARARRVVPISELVFGTLTQNRSSLEPSLGFAAIPGTPRIENGGPFAVDFANGRQDGITSSSMRPKIFWGPVCGREAGLSSPFRVPLWLFKSLYVWYTIHNAGRAGNRGKSKRRLKTTPVLGQSPKHQLGNRHNSRARPRVRPPPAKPIAPLPSRRSITLAIGRNLWTSRPCRPRRTGGTC
jgi:hypothetical protein